MEIVTNLLKEVNGKLVFYEADLDKTIVNKSDTILSTNEKTLDQITENNVEIKQLELELKNQISFGTTDTSRVAEIRDEIATYTNVNFILKNSLSKIKSYLKNN